MIKTQYDRGYRLDSYSGCRRAPVLYQSHCLACHGEPAGTIDLSGFPKEGAQVGDVAGASSITIPLGRP